MMQVVANIFDFGTEHRTTTGAVYDNDVIRRAVEEFNKNVDHKFVYLHPNTPDTISDDLSKVVGTVKGLSVKEDGIYAEMELIDTPLGKVAQKLIDNGFDMQYSPDGYGRVVGGKVLDYTMRSVTIVPPES